MQRRVMPRICCASPSPWAERFTRQRSCSFPRYAGVAKARCSFPRLWGKVPKADGDTRQDRAAVGFTAAEAPPSALRAASPASGGSKSSLLFLPPLAGEGAEGGWGRAARPRRCWLFTAVEERPLQPCGQLPPQAGEARAHGCSFPRLRGKVPKADGGTRQDRAAVGFTAAEERPLQPCGQLPPQAGEAKARGSSPADRGERWRPNRSARARSLSWWSCWPLRPARAGSGAGPRGRC